MALLLDSASLDDAAAAAGLGFVGGFTTNPTLMARCTTEPLPHFALLLEAIPQGPAFYQPTSEDAEAICAEARAAAALAPERVVIKVPASAAGVRAAAALRDESIRCAMTAVYAPAQGLLAHEVGCAWAIPYVDRAERQGLDSLRLVQTLADLLAHLDSHTRVLAASLKTSEQVVECFLHGATDITASLGVLAGLSEHPLSDAAIREFAAAALRGRQPSP